MASQSNSRARSALILVVALFLAGAVALFVLKHLNDMQAQLAEAQKPPPTQSVVYATHELYMGMPIGTADVEIREVPVEPPGMIPPDATFATVEEVVGRTPRERILGQEMIRNERLARRDAGIGLNALITPGRRAITIAIATESGVAGFIRPGNFVDVIVTVAPEDKEDIDAMWVTTTLLKQVKVLAVGDSLSQTDTPPPAGAPQKSQMSTRLANDRPSVTLELSPEDSEKLALANQKGTITLALRADTDVTQSGDITLTTQEDLLGRPGDKPATPTYAPTKHVDKPDLSVDVVSGSDRTQAVFDPITGEFKSQKKK